jgi:hypothetical protein
VPTVDADAMTLDAWVRCGEFKNPLRSAESISQIFEEMGIPPARFVGLGRGVNVPTGVPT